MKTVCPQCKQKYEIDDAYNGFEIKCLYCETDFIVQKICKACDGLGVKYADDSHKKICKNCDGTGIIVPKKRKRRDGTVKDKITQPSNTSVHDCVKLPDCSTPVKLKISQNISVEDYVKWSKKQKNSVKGLGRKYTNGGNGEVCHVCNGWGEIYESSGSLYQNPPRSSKSSSDFDSSIIKGGCGSTVLLILYIIGGLIASVCLMGTAHSGNEGILCILGYIVITLIFAGFAFLFLLETWSKRITVSLLCFFIVFLIFCGVKGKRLGTSDFESHKRTNTANSGIPTEEELMYPMDGKDPKNWRKQEEDLENRLPHLKNAPYACKRCGMKSDRPLDDPQGVWGRNGVCAYCIDYLHSTR